MSLLWIVMLVTTLLASRPCAAAELPLAVYPSFRVETDLFECDETTPQSQHLILFDAGVVYDWPVGSGSVIT
ncbi:MAG: hypothetical protein ACO1RT_17010, partial [Planctomycetaceae bacterium]